MIIETAVIAGGIWKALGKRIVIWYSHRAVSWRLRTAAARADALVTTSPHGCNVYPAKRYSIGHGINTERLMVTGHLVSTMLASSQNTTAALQPITLTHIGRITPIKKCEVLLDAAALLHGQGLRNVRVIFAGEPYTDADHAYKKKLQERITMLVTTHGLPHFAAAIEWRGRIAHSALPALFAESMYTVNMAPAGGMDKTVIESWIAGIPALVSNPAFTEAYTGALGSPSAAAAFMFREGDAHSLAEHINQALVARRHTYPKIGSADMRPAFMHRAQKYFIEYFGVEAFIQRLVHILR
jgi:glycosyltransferase involved in cell wall biosynthesis